MKNKKWRLALSDQEQKQLEEIARKGKSFALSSQCIRRRMGSKEVLSI